MPNRSVFVLVCVIMAILCAIASCWCAFHDRSMPLAQFWMLFGLFWLMIRSS